MPVTRGILRRPVQKTIIRREPDEDLFGYPDVNFRRVCDQRL
jgi:hypothetical protein